MKIPVDSVTFAGDLPDLKVAVQGARKPHSHSIKVHEWAWMSYDIQGFIRSFPADRHKERIKEGEVFGQGNSYPQDPCLYDT
jgi:hypothetical protein